LDREERDEFSIQVRAHDLGVPRLYDVTTVHLQVDDVNDNVPSFKISHQVVVVSEDIIVGQVIGHVATAVDADVDDVIYYHLIDDVSGGKFRLSDTKIIVTSSLDRETSAKLVWLL